ncbi:MAG TPA: hypothetical protein VI636_15375 [Candidatus Angelobacter sp.]
MARGHLRRKLRTYHSLSTINHHFAAISRHVWRLEQAGFMRVDKMRVLQGLVRELQSQISHDIVDRMHALEDRDMFEFGKVRIAWEHRLNPSRPAFRQQ